MSILLVTDGASRKDLAETLALLNLDAKRLPHVVEPSTTKGAPTLWTIAHRRINAVLDEWQAAS
jgi:hypothetical protein